MKRFPTQVYRLTAPLMVLLFTIGIYVPSRVIFAQEPQKDDASVSNLHVVSPSQPDSPQSIANKPTKVNQPTAKDLHVVSPPQPDSPQSKPPTPQNIPAVVTVWSVNSSVSPGNPQVNQNFTVTAYASQDVGPTPYYIQIYYGTTRYASCGVGTSCSTGMLYASQAGIYTFQVRIADAAGNTIQASANLDVNVSFAESVRLSVPFLTQVGSAGVPGSGSMNCGPASVAMTINAFGGSITVENAAMAIRGSNEPGNGPTDFKSLETQTLLIKYGLSTRSVSTFDAIRGELTTGHPVIILVNNTKYRNNTPMPYLNNNDAWFTVNHIIVVTGYDSVNVYVNDPLRYGSASLEYYAIPVDMFKDAASTTSYSTANAWYAMSVLR